MIQRGCVCVYILKSTYNKQVYNRMSNKDQEFIKVCVEKKTYFENIIRANFVSVILGFD